MDVERTVVELLDKVANGWFDSLEGEDEIRDAVEGVVREGVNALEREDMEEMKETAGEFWAKW